MNILGEQWQPQKEIWQVIKQSRILTNLFAICSYYKYVQEYLYREDKYIYTEHPPNSVTKMET